MRKILYPVLAGIILAFLFSACADVERTQDDVPPDEESTSVDDSSTPQSEVVEEEPPVIVDQDGDGVDDNVGEAVASVLDENWPDIPIMEGMTARTCESVSDEDCVEGFMVIADGTVPLIEVIVFYRNLEGWEKVESESESDDVTGQAVFDMVRGDEHLNVALSWDFGFTTLILTWVRDSDAIE